MSRIYRVILKDETYYTYLIEADTLDEATNIASTEYSAKITTNQIEEPDGYLTVHDAFEVESDKE